MCPQKPENLNPLEESRSSTPSPPQFRHTDGRVTGLSFRTDSPSVLVSASSGGGVHVWDLENERLQVWTGPMCTMATRWTMLEPPHVPHPKTCTSGSITCGAVRSARTSFLQAQHTLKPDPMSQICPGPHKLNRKSFAGIPSAIPKP